MNSTCEQQHPTPHRHLVCVAAQGIFLVVVWIRPVHKVACFLLPIFAASLSLFALALQIGSLQSEYGWSPANCSGGVACAVDVVFTWAFAALALVAFIYYSCTTNAFRHYTA